MYSPATHRSLRECIRRADAAQFFPTWNLLLQTCTFPVLETYLHGVWDPPLLHLAAQRPAAVDVLRELCEYGCVNSTQTKTGRTALHAAASGGCAAGVRVLLGAGALVNARDADGNTALHAAAENCAAGPDMVRHLFEFGADPRLQNTSGATALHLAAQCNVEVMRALLRMWPGLDATLADADGDTVLHYAARSQEGPAAAAALLATGLPQDVPNSAGLLPRQVAETEDLKYCVAGTFTGRESKQEAPRPSMTQRSSSAALRDRKLLRVRWEEEDAEKMHSFT